MIIHVKVHPGYNIEKIVRFSDKELEVWLKERAVKGKSNLALIKILAREFKVPQENIKIKNPKARKKVVEILK